MAIDALSLQQQANNQSARYLVVNEQNHPVFESQCFLLAMQEADLLNYSDDDHYFFVEQAHTH